MVKRAQQPHLILETFDTEDCGNLVESHVFDKCHMSFILGVFTLLMTYLCRSTSCHMLNFGSLHIVTVAVKWHMMPPLYIATELLQTANRFHHKERVDELREMRSLFHIHPKFLGYVIVISIILAITGPLRRKLKEMAM